MPVNDISIKNSHRHADSDGPDSDILHAVDPVPGVPNSFGDKIDTEHKDQGTDDADSCERSLISIGSEICNIDQTHASSR